MLSRILSLFTDRIKGSHNMLLVVFLYHLGSPLDGSSKCLMCKFKVDLTINPWIWYLCTVYETASSHWRCVSWRTWAGHSDALTNWIKDETASVLPSSYPSSLLSPCSFFVWIHLYPVSLDSCICLTVLSTFLLFSLLLHLISLFLSSSRCFLSASSLLSAWY